MLPKNWFLLKLRRIKAVSIEYSCYEVKVTFHFTSYDFSKRVNQKFFYNAKK